MKELENYKKYIGKYIRNQYGIAEVVDIIEKSGNICLLLDNRIVYFIDTTDNSICSQYLSDTYPITEYTQNLDERIKPLIELIEPGDYVNGYKVNDVQKEYLIDKNKEGTILYIEKEGFINATITEGTDEIKDVVTREQFEKIKYIV